MKNYFPCDSNKDELILPSVDELEFIFSHIGDSRSRLIFESRLLYSLSMDEKYLWNMIKTNNKISDFKERIKNGAYIYGAGQRGNLLVEIFDDIEWKGYIDIEKKGQLNQIPIYGLEIVNNLIAKDEIIVISNKRGYEDIKKYLVSAGFDEEKILCLTLFEKVWFGNIYFDERCLSGIDKCNGIFLDIGCYDGKDSLNAISFFKTKDVQVHAFEPDRKNYDICKSVLENNKKVRLFQKGVSNKMGDINFNEGGPGAKIDKLGSAKIEVTTIDHHLLNNKVGFIKMDIEGAEEAAIEGGRNSILRDKPILALSIYHKRSDIWRLPLKVLQLYPNYRLEFEHQLFSWGDTVMYAIPERE